MRRLILSLLLLGLLASAATPTVGVAAPTDARMTIQSQARWAVGAILVPISYICPAVSGAGGTIFLQVTQVDTGGHGQIYWSVPCTGQPEQTVVVVPGVFTPGQALAGGLLFSSTSAFFGDEDRRRIQIVV